MRLTEAGRSKHTSKHSVPKMPGAGTVPVTGSEESFRDSPRFGETDTLIESMACLVSAFTNSEFV